MQRGTGLLWLHAEWQVRARKCQRDRLPALGDGPGTLARTRKQARATYRQRTFDRQPLRDDVDRALAPIFESVREERVAAAKLSSSLPTPGHLENAVERPEQKGAKGRCRFDFCVRSFV